MPHPARKELHLKTEKAVSTQSQAPSFSSPSRAPSLSSASPGPAAQACPGVPPARPPAAFVCKHHALCFGGPQSRADLRAGADLRRAGAIHLRGHHLPVLYQRAPAGQYGRRADFGRVCRLQHSNSGLVVRERRGSVRKHVSFFFAALFSEPQALGLGFPRCLPRGFLDPAPDPAFLQSCNCVELAFGGNVQNLTHTHTPRPGSRRVGPISKGCSPRSKQPPLEDGLARAALM